MPRRKRVVAADLYCGGGGTSKGLALALEQLGVPKKDIDLVAINHWDAAIVTHTKNHPWARHICAPAESLMPRTVVPSGRLRLLIAAPECTHFSTARGGKPKSDQKRASAWEVLRWTSELVIDNILIENVPEFRTWGPLGVDGQPLQSKKGVTYRLFLNALRRQGYSVSARVLNAADYGDATSRRRLFIMAKRGKHIIAWPRQTHSKGGKVRGTKPWRAAREVIDWSLEGKSIFDRKRRLAPATMRRILAGLEKFGGDELKPFLIILRGGEARQLEASAHSIDEPVPGISANGNHAALVQTSYGGRSLDPADPLPTITTARGGDIGVANATIVSAGGPRMPPRSVDEPLNSVLTRDHMGVAKAFILGQHGNAALRPAEEPMPTIAAAGKIAKVDAFLLGQNGGAALRPVDQPVPTVAAGGAIAKVDATIVTTDRPDTNRSLPRSVEEPLPTVMGAKERIGIADAIIVQTGQTGGNGQYVRSVEDPLPTVTSNPQIGKVDAFVMRTGCRDLEPKSVDQPLPTVMPNERLNVFQGVIVPPNGVYGGNQPRSVDEPLPTITQRGDEIGLAEPFILPPAGFHQEGGNHNPPRSLDEPLQALTQRGGGHLVSAHLQTHFGERDGQGPRTHSVEDPMPTITQREPALVEGFLVNYHGQSEASPIRDPAPTFGTKQQLGLAEPFMLEYHGGKGADDRVRPISDPVPTLDTADRIALVRPVIDGYTLDIRFRMLQPHELAAAMGFPPEYEFVGKREQVVRMIGNAVAVNMAKALCLSLLNGKKSELEGA